MYNKVKQVTTDQQYTRYLYDGAGNRVISAINNVITGYVRDASGNTLAVYDLSNPEETPFFTPRMQEAYIYGSNRIGVDNTIRTHPRLIVVDEWHKDLTTTHYEISNHLGNVLTTVTGRKLGQGQNGEVDHYLPEVVSATDYYPFGQQMPGRSYENPAYSGTNDYRYAFNGKEHDKSGEFGSLAHYDYGFRIYNPSIGKFLSVDPLTRDYPMLTPYQFASNTPIQAIDLDGLEAGYVQYFHVIKDDKGRYVTKKLTKPSLQTTNGEWSGIKNNTLFNYEGKWYDSQSKIPGWTNFRNRQQEKVNRQAKNISLIVGGIVTVATIIPTGGQSGTAFSNLVAGFGVTSGVYAASSGITKFSLELANHPEISDKVPNGVLNATVGIVIKSQIDDKEVTETVDAILSLSEGVATFNFKNTNTIQKIDNFMIILNNKDAIDQTIDIILPQNNNCDDECDK